MWRVSWATAFMKACYLFMLRFIPNMYELMYRFTGGRSGGLSVQSLISAFTARDIAALVKKYRPEAVICTHPFPAGAASWRKKRHPKEFLYATVITDYSVHQMWIYPNTDCYFVAREEMKTDLIAARVQPEKVFVTGIPVTSKFHQREDREVILESLGLSPERKTVLFITHDVEEAIFLSGRVLVAECTPIRALTSVQVPLGYPRSVETLRDPAAAELKEHLIRKLRRDTL